MRMRALMCMPMCARAVLVTVHMHTRPRQHTCSFVGQPCAISCASAYAGNGRVAGPRHTRDFRPLLQQQCVHCLTLQSGQ